MEIKKIKLSELEAFLKSDFFRALKNKPISSFRVLSQINNPRAQKDDVVLYLGMLDGELVAYRSLFGDYVGDGEKKTRFGWCSGNWVHPGYRRKGYSKKLLDEALNDWDGKLMFTNYAPASLNLYLQSGRFIPIYGHQGARCYLFPKLGKLLRVNNKWKNLLVPIDLLIALFAHLRLLFYHPQKTNTYTVETLPNLDKFCFDVIKKSQGGQFFSRGEKEFSWIFGFPWVSTHDNGFVRNYQFSSFSKSFRYQVVKVYHKHHFEGFFMFSEKDGHLKTLYFYLSKQHVKFVASWLKGYCKKEKIEVLTTYHPVLSKEFLDSKYPFLFVREYGQNIYATFQPEIGGKQVQDGDGDVVFT